MNGMKLLAAPLLVSISWQPCNCDLLQLPAGIVQTGPAPFFVHHWIAKRSPVSSTHAFAMISGLVRIIVALGAGEQSRLTGPKVSTTVFHVTGGATDAGILVGSNNCCYKRFRVVAT